MMLRVKIVIVNSSGNGNARILTTIQLGKPLNLDATETKRDLQMSILWLVLYIRCTQKFQNADNGFTQT